MGNISISGKDANGVDVGTYWLNLYESGARWEGKSTDGLFSATSGTWHFKTSPDLGVYVMDSAGILILLLRGLKPGEAKVGDKGFGNTEVSGRTVSWKVDSL